MPESNEFIIFEEYIKFVCRKIMSVKKRNEVREELYSHFLEEYDKNIALGLNDLSAQQKAIEKMGNKENLADDFGKIYSIVPTEYMRSSLNFIIWGMILSHFHIKLFIGMKEITTFIGQALLIYGLFKLRKTEKRLNQALILSVAISAIGIVLQGICYYIVDYSDLMLAWSSVTIFTSILTYWWLFSGIRKLCETVITEKDKSPRLYLAFAMWVLFALTVYSAYLSEMTEIVLIAPIYLIIMLCQLGKAKNVLSHQEPEFELKQSLNQTENIIYWVLIAALAITPVISMVVAANTTPDYEVYNSADTDVSKKDIESAKSHILKLGLPEDVLKDLPDSEILKYTDATYLQVEKKREYTKNNIYGEKIVATSQIFNFYFDDAEMRVLTKVDIPDNSVIKYRSGVYFNFYNEDFVPLYDGNGLDDYDKLYLALSENGNKTLSYHPLSEYTPDNSLENFYSAGFEFSFDDADTNRRVYVAHSARIANPTIMHYMCTDGVLYWQQFPISAEFKSINDMAKEYLSGRISFGNDFDSIEKQQLYNSFEFNESYLIEDENIDFNTID